MVSHHIDGMADTDALAHSDTFETNRTNSFNVLRTDMDYNFFDYLSNFLDVHLTDMLVDMFATSDNFIACKTTTPLLQFGSRRCRG